ncbi:MAG: GAF domain-containing protein, partial [Planctomycetota bacterium]
MAEEPAPPSAEDKPVDGDLLESMLAAIPAAAAFLDDEGRLLRFNAAWSRGSGAEGLCQPTPGVAFPPKTFLDDSGFARLSGAVGRILDGTRANSSVDLQCGCNVNMGRCAAGGVLVVVSPAPGGNGAVRAEPTLTRIQEALTALSRSDLLARGGLERAFGGITQAAAHTIAVERVSIWLFDEDREHLECHDLFRRSDAEHSRGVVLDAATFPRYVKALQTQRSIRADDAVHDERTSEFAEDYLIPLNIVSMLDAPIRVRGRVAGVVCLEHVGESRRWTSEEEVFAGSLAEMASSVLEAHEHRLMEQALSDQDARFRAFVNRTAEAIWCLEAEFPIPVTLPSKDQATRLFDTTLTECNDALARYFGHETSRSAEGLKFRSLVDTEHETYRWLFERFVRSGHRLMGEEFVVDGNGGSERWLRCHAAGVIEDGLLLRVIGTFQDVSDEKLLRDQLQKSQRLESIGCLAGGIAHDFNNLLSVILGYSELAADRLPGGHPSERALDQIRRASERAAGLTRQLLTFARRQFVEPQIVDLNERVEDVDALLRRVVGEDVTLETRLHSGLWPVRVDPGQFEQVLLNLAVNARDAMPDGGVLELASSNLTLDVTDPTPVPDMEPGDWVRIDVRDTGTGMDASTLEHMFEPFFTTKGPGSGTGLGLATCHGIISQSGGQV